MTPQKRSTVFKQEKVRQKAKDQTNDGLRALNVDQVSIFDDLDDVGHDDGRKLGYDAAPTNDIDQGKEVFEGPVGQNGFEDFVPDLKNKNVDIIFQILCVSLSQHLIQ